MARSAMFWYRAKCRAAKLRNNGMWYSGITYASGAYNSSSILGIPTTKFISFDSTQKARISGLLLFAFLCVMVFSSAPYRPCAIQLLDKNQSHEHMREDERRQLKRNVRAIGHF